MKYKILLIEDEESILENISILLSSYGYEVFTAENGGEGVRLAAKVLPDLIICDIMMPQMDGYSVLQEVSRSRETSTVPFLFLSAKVDRADIRKGMDLGADDYLFKPFKAEELLNAVKTRLERFETIKAEIEDDKDQPQEKLTPQDKIFFRIHGQAVPVTVNNIRYIIAERQYTNVHAHGHKPFVTSRAMKSNIKPVLFSIERISYPTFILRIKTAGF